MFKVTKCDKKKSDWYVIEVINAAGEIVSDISVNRTNKKGEVFPNFDQIAVGATIEGQLWQNTAGKFYLFPPKEQKKDSSPAARDAGLAEIKNILQLQIMPALEAMDKELKSISGKVFREE